MALRSLQTVCLSVGKYKYYSYEINLYIYIVFCGQPIYYFKTLIIVFKFDWCYGSLCLWKCWAADQWTCRDRLVRLPGVQGARSDSRTELPAGHLKIKHIVQYYTINMLEYWTYLELSFGELVKFDRSHPQPPGIGLVVAMQSVPGRILWLATVRTLPADGFILY